MTREQVEKLAEVLTSRLSIQYSSEKYGERYYTPEQLLYYALEEAWENDELAFLN